MQAGQLSSTLREVMNARICLAAVLRSAHDLRGGLLTYVSDSQAAVFCLSGMRGTGRILAEVKRVYSLAAQHDVHFEFQWLSQRPPHAACRFPVSACG